MTTAIVLALAAGFGAIASEECGQCSDAALCAAHQVAQAAAVKAAKPKLRGGDPVDRILAVQELARINHEHPRLPSSEIAVLAEAALQDESMAVRAEAAKALADGMQPETAVRSLVSALENVRGDLAKLGGGGRFGQPDGEEKDPKVQERRKLRDEAVRYARAIVDGLGKLPDDRSVDALADFLPQLSFRSGGELTDGVGKSLVALDARKGIEALVQKIKLSPAGAGPFGPDPTGKTLHDLLTTSARSKGLADPPPWSTKEPPDWEKWFAKNQKSYAAKLGKYDLEKMRKAKAKA